MSVVTNINHLTWWGFGLGALVLLIIIVVIVAWLRRTQHSRQISKAIRDLSHQQLRNIFVPDDVDGEIWIDCLLLTDGGLVVLDIRDYTGNLFGGETINEWTQLIAMKSYKFNNPLLELPARLHAIKVLAGDIPVTGRVIFSHRGSFPKGVPDGVCMIDELYDDLSNFLRPALPEERRNTAWTRVHEAVIPSTSGKN